MQRYIYIILVATVFSACSGRDTKKNMVETNMVQDAKMLTTVEVANPVHDFGEIAEGQVVEYSFRFTNTGSKPLVVSNVSASCGCTVPEKPEEPVKPGESGFIKVKFDSNRRPGETSKSITVIANTEPAFPTLTIKGIVKEKAQ